MKKMIFVLLVLSLAACTRREERRSPASQQGVPASVMKPRPAEVVTESGPLTATWALSLKGLQSEAQHLQMQGQPMDPLLKQLGELSRISALFFEDDDVLLAGDREPDVPAYDLDQLAVGLRNAFAVGKEYEGVIGCTIDPRPGKDPWSLQDARVFGGPHRSTMGKLHIEIDYELKRVGAGYSSMPSVSSAFDRNRGPICEQKSGGYQAAHRYWFTPRYPASPRFLEDETAVWIQRPVMVQLQTEEEFLEKGRRVGAREARPEAVEFARQVTTVLEGNEAPMAAQLRQSFRIIEVAKLIQRRPGTASAVQFLLKDYRIEEPFVPTEVKGVVRSESQSAVCGTRTETIPVANGVQTVTHQQTMTYRREYRGASARGNS